MVDVKVRQGTATLFLFLISAAFCATNNAEVPEFTDIPYLQL